MRALIIQKFKPVVGEGGIRSRCQFYPIFIPDLDLIEILGYARFGGQRTPFHIL